MVQPKYMQRALELARLGRGSVSPNPQVGAVLVCKDQIVSEGYHTKFGEPHAEIHAIRAADPDQLKGADLYVNLEPCSHQGKTPPCTEKIIKAGIGRVIYGMKDPNPLVAGKGLEKLRNSGIEVIGPVMEDACRNLNHGYISVMTKQRPFITVKIAQTLDGKIALPNGASKWITGLEARKYVHQLRAEHDAVLVGSKTVLLDDPELSVRLIEGVNPRKIVLDSALNTPVDAKIIQKNPEKTIIIHNEHAAAIRIETLQKSGVRLISAKLKDNRLDLHSVWSEIIQAGVTSLLVEGGSKIFSYFLKLEWIDRLCLIVAPKIFGSGLAPFDQAQITKPDLAYSIQDLSCTKLGDDYLFEGVISCLQA